MQEFHQVDIYDANRQTLRDLAKKTDELIKDGYDNFKKVQVQEVKKALDTDVDSLVQETLTYIKTNPEANKTYKKLLALVQTDPNYHAPKGKDKAILYTIEFRLQQLGFADTTQVDEKRNFLYNLMNFQFKAKEQKIDDPKVSKIEGVCGPRALNSLLAGLEVTSGVIEKEKQAVFSKTQQELLGLELGIVGGSTNKNPNITVITNEKIKNTEIIDAPTKIIKKFEVATALSNSMDNISEDELKAFEKLEKKVNKGEKLYMEFENSIIEKIEKAHKEKGIQIPSKDIKQDVGDLLKNYSEGYLEDNEEALKEIELDPNFFFAIRDTIVEFLFDSNRTTDQKRWLILFVRSFTNNFNDILQSCEAELKKSALSMVASKYLSLK